MRGESKKLLIVFDKGGGGCVAKFSVQMHAIGNGTSYVNIFTLWFLWEYDIRGGLQN